MVLRASECKHVTADHWAAIAGKLLKLEQGEELIVITSDEHKGGLTSYANEGDPVMRGFAKLARYLVLAGDRHEHETMTALKMAVDSLNGNKEKIKKLSKKEYNRLVQKTAENILYEKIEDDAAETESIVEEDENRIVIELAGNHTNSREYRNKVQRIESKHKNFQFSTELEVIDLSKDAKSPDDHGHGESNGVAKKLEDKGDVLLVQHGDLPSNDGIFVEDGYTDAQRKIYSLKGMAKKALNTLNPWMPSATWQEALQLVVNVARASKNTAQELYTELLYRAQQSIGIQMQEGHLKSTKNALRTCEIAIKKLTNRKEDIKELLENLPKKLEQEHIKPKKQQIIIERYKQKIENLDKELEDLHAQADELAGKSHKLHTSRKNLEKEVLHYKIPGDRKSHELTPEVVENITHMASGHTHNPDIRTEINGMNGKKVIVSNSGSMTEYNMRVKVRKNKDRIFEDKINPDTGKETVTDLTQLGTLLYVVKDGKVERITSIGKLLEEKWDTVAEEVKKIPRTSISAPTLYRR